MKLGLKEDIHSFGRDRIIYGFAGEVVSLISYRPPMYIVETTKGERFPVHEKKVIIINQ